MRLAYGDLIGGVSGDMFVAALLDLGLPLRRLRVELQRIPTVEFEIKAAKKSVHSIRATRFHVTCPKNEAQRSWKQIRELIKRSKLDAKIKATGMDVFSCLAQAEAKIHGIAVDDVHFHEVGATDSIVDVMAASIGIHDLGIDAFYFSRIPLGHGVTRSQHGSLPVPGPAALELLKGLPVFGVDVNNETVTPTGAALLRALGKSFGESGTGWQREEMLVIETNIDDMNPQFYDHIMERLLAAGARDVYLAAIQMKKNRPGTLLRVIGEPRDRDKLSKIIFQETSTIGIRCYPIGRIILQRELKKVKTRYGDIAVKIAEQPDGSKRAAPEYDDIKRIAVTRKLPIKLIHDEVMRIVGK
jgi:uncharacterized protein (DUF111 family)